MSGKTVPQVYRRLSPHLGHVLVREQVRRSSALSLLSPGNQDGTVWALGVLVSAISPVTVMVISHPVFSWRP